MRRVLVLALLAFPLALAAQPGDVNERLREAARRNDLAAFRSLLAGGADVNAQDAQQDSAFLIAARDGRTEIVAAALAAGANVRTLNRYGSTALFGPSYRGHLETVRELLKAPFDLHHVNSLGWTALLEAIVLGQDSPRHQQIVKLLIDAGSDVNQRDRDGMTALQHAQRKGQVEVAQMLRAAGAR